MATTTAYDKIGASNINFATGGTGAAEEFTQETSTGGTLTQEKVDASHVKFRTLSKSVDDLVDGGGDVNIAVGTVACTNITPSGTLTMSAMTTAGYVKNNGSGVFSGGNSIAAGDLPTLIDAAKIADGTVSNAEFQRLNGVTSSIQDQIDAVTGYDVGDVLQTVHYASATSATGTHVIPYDDTKPQSDEGVEWTSQTITMTDTDNYLEVDCRMFLSGSGGYYVTAAIFIDAEADCRVSATKSSYSGYSDQMTLPYYRFLPGTATCAIAIRYGVSNGSYNYYLNRTIDGEKMDDTLFSTLTIREIKV